MLHDQLKECGLRKWRGREPAAAEMLMVSDELVIAMVVATVGD